MVSLDLGLATVCDISIDPFCLTNGKCEARRREENRFVRRAFVSLTLSVKPPQEILIVLGPHAEKRYSLRELCTDWSEAVINVWRHYWMNKALDKTLSL
jgi:hypothetical protein